MVRLFRTLGGGVVAATLEAVAVTVHLEDVDVMGEPVQQRAGEAFRAEDLEEEFRPGEGQGHEAQFINDQQAEAGQIPLQVEQTSFVPGLQRYS